MHDKKNIVIMGGGLSSISLAYFLQDSNDVEKITILEKEHKTGGLCRSIRKDGYIYDIGPHILFSKDKEILNLMLKMLGDNKNSLKRSNQIIHKGTWIKYPFENDLSKLSRDELKYCVTTFKNNPYENYAAGNMLQFFLKTFGEGITNTYLRPYNEKIWKYDPCFMDTQMVDRIPKPTHEEIMRSASGETVDGYIHQLYFSFPAEGGIEAVFKAFESKLGIKVNKYTDHEVTRISKQTDGSYIVSAGDDEYTCNTLVSTIPIQDLAATYEGTPDKIKDCVADLKYNSIIIVFVKVGEDLCGDNFAFYNAEKDIIFHRISKMDFLGEKYHLGLGATYMVEITYRKGDYTDSLDRNTLIERVSQGIVDIGFARKQSDVKFIDIYRHPYAYVIYDLKHKENMMAVRKYYESEGVFLNGRFGNFEYWNMDKVVRESKNLAEKRLFG